MLEQLLVILSVTAVVMVIPGPDMLLVVRNTFTGGRVAGLKTSAGILGGNLVHITYCLLGIGLIISQSIQAYSALRYAAAAYLVYLGLVSLRAGAGTVATVPLDGQQRDSPWFVQGFANNLLNPKGTLFYLGIFTTVITPGTSTRVMLILIVAMMLVSASFWLLFVHLLDRPTVRGVMERSQRTANLALGGLLIAFGLRVALED